MTFKAPTRAGQSHTRQEKGEGPTPDSRHRGLLSAAPRGDTFQVYFSLLREAEKCSARGRGHESSAPAQTWCLADAWSSPLGGAQGYR